MIAESAINSPSIALASTPVHKLALGVAVGLVAGAAVFVLTAFHVALPPTSDGLNMGLLAQYFYGYEVSWKGSLVGFGWGFLTGFVMGWFVAFVRNFVVTTIAFAFMTDDEIAQTRRFLDHI